MPYDVDAVRKHFPALTHGTAYFDGPGGSQVPDTVAEAVAATLTSGISNRGTVTDAELRAERAVHDGRRAIADLLGADPRGVVFGRSMTALTYEFAAALAKTWRPGDEVVVTCLDHDANVRPWVQAAEAAGATVRWAPFEPDVGELPVARIAELLSPRTRLVAVTAAANLVGTRPDIAGIADAVHRCGALFYVDAVHAVPHFAVDLGALGADFLACSPYKFFGPHLGVLVADPELLDTIHPDKLKPSSDEVPERFERGTLPYELLAGTTAAVDFLAGLGGESGARRDRLRAGMRVVERHEDTLRRRLEQGLADIAAVTRHSRAAHRTPTTLFSVAGHAPRQVARWLADAGVNAPAGTFYATECARLLGLGPDGAVRAGIAPYTNESDVDRLIGAVAELAG